MKEKQISSFLGEKIGYIHFDFPFFIASGHMYGKTRWLAPIWPPQPESYTIPLGTNFHYHAHYELIYVLEGTFTQHLENSVYCLNAGDCTLLNSQIRHYEGNETDCSCIYINFSPEFLCNLFNFNSIGADLPQHESRYIMHLCDGGQSETDCRESLDFRRTSFTRMAEFTDSPDNPKTIISEIISTLSHARCGYIFSLQCLLLRLFASLENPDYFHITRIYADSSTKEVLFSEIQHYVRERNGRITREELSDLLHYNADYLGRIVKQQCGMTFLQYCRTFWIKKAAELLRDTEMNVTDIIHFLGFENKNNFYTAFQDSMGMTPIEYRERNRRENPQ